MSSPAIGVPRPPPPGVARTMLTCVKCIGIRSCARAMFSTRQALCASSCTMFDVMALFTSGPEQPASNEAASVAARQGQGGPC
jgi:hypothetical protein